MKNSSKFLIAFLTVLVILAFPSAVMASSSLARTINGDQFIIGQSFTLTANDTLNGSLVVVGGTATLEDGSVVNGDVVLVGAAVSIAGEVTGDLTIIGSAGSVANTTRVIGDLTSVGNGISIAPEARIMGQTNIDTDTNVDFGDTIGQTNNWDFGFDPIGRMLWNLFVVVAVAALAVLVALLFPKPTQRVANAISRAPILSWGIGLLTTMVFPVVLILMVVTVILILVVPFAVLALVIAFLFGWIALGFEIGDRIAKMSKTNWSEPLSAGLGTLLIGLVSAAFTWIPCVGWLVPMILIMFGLGAIILTRVGTAEYGVTPVTTAAVVVQPPADTNTPPSDDHTPPAA